MSLFPPSTVHRALRHRPRRPVTFFLPRPLPPVGDKRQPTNISTVLTTLYNGLQHPISGLALRVSSLPARTPTFFLVPLKLVLILLHIRLALAPRKLKLFLRIEKSTPAFVRTPIKEPYHGLWSRSQPPKQASKQKKGKTEKGLTPSTFNPCRSFSTSSSGVSRKAYPFDQNLPLLFFVWPTRVRERTGTPLAWSASRRRVSVVVKETFLIWPPRARTDGEGLMRGPRGACLELRQGVEEEEKRKEGRKREGKKGTDEVGYGERECFREETSLWWKTRGSTESVV
jgi:hypothetical protein